MAATIAFSTLLVLLSGALLLAHWRGWRQREDGSPSAEDQAFHRGQLRRRLAASGLIGAVGVLLLGELWLPRSPWAMLYWLGVLGLVLVILLLAGADWFAARRHYRRLAQTLQAQRQALLSDLRQSRGARPRS